MRIVRLGICLGYWALLSVLLLVPDPAAVVPLPEVPAFLWSDVALHFAAFALLAVLTYAARWPQPPGWPLTVVLLGYSIATESLQALVPQRTAALKDYVGNVFGIVVGAALYRLVHRAVRPHCDAAVRKATGNPNPGS